MSKVLIIDDDKRVCKTLHKAFTRKNHEADTALTLKQGIDKVFSGRFDVVFLDVNFPEGNGLEAIPTIRAREFAPEVIIMTGEGDPEGAELAIRSRAWDYLQKGSSYKDFLFSLDRALAYRQQKKEADRPLDLDRRGILGQSRALHTCLEKVAAAAKNDLPILITGETGTGKELFSRAVHKNSGRTPGNYVVVDCTALPEHLVESALFGHEKGAFTGADTSRTGLIKMADRGTLFLDEIGELPLGIQQKFLRALQEKRFRPVGGKKEIQSDFRLISATHCDLAEMVKQGQFREDLFFRLFSVHILLPPLRERDRDIREIARDHIEKRSRTGNHPACSLSEEFIAELSMYEWPGNVRELLNTIDLASSEAGYGNLLFPRHLPEHIRASNIKKKFKLLDNKPAEPAAAPDRPFRMPFKAHVENAKKSYLRELLSDTRRDIPECCRVSGLSRSQLYRLLGQYDLKVK